MREQLLLDEAHFMSCRWRRCGRERISLVDGHAPLIEDATGECHVFELEVGDAVSHVDVREVVVDSVCQLNAGVACAVVRALQAVEMIALDANHKGLRRVLLAT